MPKRAAAPVAAAGFEAVGEATVPFEGLYAEAELWAADEVQVGTDERVGVTVSLRVAVVVHWT